MRILKVIESRHWVHATGSTASIYGAVPWTDGTDRAHWSVETHGWTWLCFNGTIGLGRKPTETREEAIEIMNRVNQRS